MNVDQITEAIINLVFEIRGEAYADGTRQHGMDLFDSSDLRHLLNALTVAAEAQEPEWTPLLSEADERKLMERSVERTEDDVTDAIYELFPFAQLAADADGWLLIQPNIMYTGKHGQNFIGPMNIDGDTPSWD